MTTMNFRVEDSLKSDFQRLTTELGITATEAITLLMKGFIKEKVEENGLYALLLSTDYVSSEEEKDIMDNLKNLTPKDAETVYEEEIEI